MTSKPILRISSLSLGQVHAIIVLAFAASVGAVLAPWRWLPIWTNSDIFATITSLSSFWTIRLTANLFGYASALLPLYLAVQLARTWDYSSRGPSGGILSRCIRLLALEGDNPTRLNDEEKSKLSKENQQHEPQQKEQRSCCTLNWCLHLAACFLGLQVAYLTWGLLQERMMTFDYNGEHFRDSQFLVFANRALGGLLALPLILLAPYSRQTSTKSTTAADQKRSPPAFEYVYSSVSNILSSWCQYEALVYVTFPTQVLAKASKIIPVMLMGRFVSRKSYRVDEYLTAGLISAGTALFLLSSPEITDASSSPSLNASSNNSASSSNSANSSGSPWLQLANPISGAALLSGYLVFDAFTSSWQSKLFASYRSGPLQMLAGSSLASCLATVAAQLQQGSLSLAMAFAYRQPLFASHLCLLSLCSTLGQLVIFHTIDKFGPVTFTIIMTVRQAFAILVSCLVYQHRLSGHAWSGIGAVFVALFLRIYFAGLQQKYRSKNKTE